MALKRTHSDTKKATDYISWDEFFMGVALLASKRSKDPNMKVGACIVNKDNVIVGVGYNGFPRGCSDDEFPWNKKSEPNERGETKHLYVCHAEANAIMNKNCCSSKDCRIYVALFPCNECAKQIIQSGIVEVIYLKKKEKKEYESNIEYSAAEKMLKAANIKIRKFEPEEYELNVCTTLEQKKK